MSESEIDGLPFGVIGLDDERTILRFNLYESLLARLDRHEVLGRNFFREIARCTRGPKFEGRFQAYVADRARRAPERFPFVFDFSFGAQEVAVEIVRGSVDDRFYFVINRKKITGPRPGKACRRLSRMDRKLSTTCDASSGFSSPLRVRRSAGTAPMMSRPSSRETCSG
jgi:photoactive yellow protein